MSIWGGRRIARRLDALQPPRADRVGPFHAMGNAAPPLIGAVVTAAVFGVGALSDGAVATALRAGTWLVVGVALWSFLWTYVTLHVGLDRLGRQRLALEDARVDAGLGLRPLGGVAFTALWMLLAWLVPLVLTGLPDVVGVAAGVVVLAAGLAAFFLSLYELHLQMVAVKQAELALARDLYARAYEPVRTSPTLETLEQQRNLLSAADALEKRARAIHDWPIDEGMFARVLTIATSVVAITIGRLILDPLGL